ncbi:MAG: tRNA (adenosine(37)-N6)-dimethylallyltransferase MiaA [Bacteroidetes bacterium]|nr:tRNA (adenosine(37)-N6)-dimethylallyltransferase MiaA [Bacteroidota bacterium]
MYKIITILGPTATGKTQLAVALSREIDGEIISADSRQVYRGMDIGTGKDLLEYTIDGTSIPYHLIDTKEPGYEYNLFEFANDFHRVLPEIIARKRTPILCGGTGMYINAILKGNILHRVKEDPAFRKTLEAKSMAELSTELASYKPLHNVSDILERNRLIRAIEIARSEAENPDGYPKVPSIVFGVLFERQVIRDRISQRLSARLNEGMIEEVQRLLDEGVSPAKLHYYGLEYRYISNYLLGYIERDEMERLLETAIHQFAKRQTTWFRKMEREGIDIQWIDGNLPLTEKVRYICNRINSDSL